MTAAQPIHGDRPRPIPGAGASWRALVAVTAAAVLSVALAPATVAAQDGTALPDVTDDAYYAAPVAALAKDGVFAGTLCDEGFCPDKPIDRKTMAVWTVRVLEGQDPGPVSRTRFEDVDADSFYAPFIERMAALGVSQGCGDGSGFCPDRNVARAEMAAFLSRAYNLPAGPDPNFSDVPDDAWYATDVAKLAASGITAGCGDGTNFCPSLDTTRGQMATFLHRAENRSPDGSAGLASGLNPAMDGGGLIATGWCAIKTDNTLICWDISTGLPDADTPAGTFAAVSGYGGDYGGHHCAIRTDRTLTCWGGNNRYGQADASEGQFIAVSANRDFSCAVRTDRTIACWGSDYRGRTDAPNGRFSAVSGACALRTDRTIACWGDYGDPPTGQFTAVSGECAIRTDGTIACWYDPLYEDDPELAREEQPPSGQFTSISNFNFAGGLNYCGIRTDATMACWGVNFHGAAIAQPGQFLAVAAGGDHSCAIRTDGAFTCWGRSDTELRMPPGQTIRADDQPTHSVQPGGEILSVGRLHTCGILADGNVSCWGDHFKGRQQFPEGRYLAVSAGAGHSCGLLADQTITCPGTHFPRSATAPPGHFLAVAAGYYHSCGLLTNLTVHCWGGNDDSQLDVPEGRYLAVSAGSDHNCGVLTDQTVTCWGSNRGGKSDAPAGQFAAVSAGVGHSCGLRTDQTVTCWGYNQGQSGAFGEQFIAVSAGGGHSCGLRTDQTATCWGDNQHGQSGAPAGRFLAVSAGSFHSCGLRTDQTVTCWGSDAFDRTTAPKLRFLDKSDSAPSASVLLPRTAHCRQTTYGAGAPGPPAGLQIVRLDATDGAGRPTRPPTLGWTRPCSGGPVDHYIVQWRRGHEDFDSTRQQIVQSAAQTEASSTEIPDRRAYEIRVTAVNSNGRSRYAQIIVPTPANHVFSVLEDVVVTFQDRHPWLNEVWVEINSPNFQVIASQCSGQAYGCVGSSTLSIGSPRTGGSRLLNERASRLGWILDLIHDGGTAVHEMAHVYHDLTDLAVNPPAIAAGWMYINELLRDTGVGQRGDCRTQELYADIPGVVMYNDGLTSWPSTPYWTSCRFQENLGQDWPGHRRWQEMGDVMRSIYVDQEVPQWFYDTYQRADGSWDVEAIKATLGYYVDADRPGPPNSLYWQLRQLIPEL